MISTTLRAPVYDDMEESTRIMRNILRDFIDPSEAPQTVAPWLGTPDELLGWFAAVKPETAFMATIDLHDNRYPDLSRFNHPEVGTDNGELTGWRVAEHILFPKMLSDEIEAKPPIVFTSSRKNVLESAQEEFEDSDLLEALQGAGIKVTFLEKPLKENSDAAKSYRRHVTGLIRDEIEASRIFDDPLSELGISGREFDHKSAALGLQEFWMLTDEEFSRVLFFDDVSGWAAFKEKDINPATHHWRDHVELLFSLKSRLSGLKPDVSERMAYERVWIRQKTSTLGGLSPLDVLMSGSMKKLESLIAYIENVEFSVDYWTRTDHH